MTRIEQLDEALKALEIVGGDDTNADGVRENLDRYLLIETNVGRAAHAQSHWFSCHASLDAAWTYHDGQEYAEDWQVVRAVDLDTGDHYVTGATTVTWHAEVTVDGNDR